MLYIVQATVSRRAPNGPDVWMEYRQIPTFYLHSDVQGIVSKEHAKNIARGIINPFNLDMRIELSVEEKEC